MAGHGYFLVHGHRRSGLGPERGDTAILDKQVAVGNDAARIIANVDGVGVTQEQARHGGVSRVQRPASAISVSARTRAPS